MGLPSSFSSVLGWMFLFFMLLTCVQSDLFDKCSCIIDTSGQWEQLIISECNDNRAALVLSANYNGSIEVDPMFVDPVSSYIKQRSVRFLNNPGLKYINWDAFLLGKSASASDPLVLREVVFDHGNDNLELQMSPMDDNVTIDRVIIFAQSAVKKVNVQRSEGITELEIYGEFVNDTRYQDKFIYGNTAGTTVQTLSIVGLEGFFYLVKDFLVDILQNGFAVSTLGGLKLRQLDFRGQDFDLSVILSGATNLKTLVLDNCYTDVKFDYDFIETILGDSYIDSCSNLSATSLPMDELTLNFADPTTVLVDEGFLGEFCPQSKRLNRSVVSDEMVWAWNRNGSTRCRVMPDDVADNTHGGACQLCVMNSRDGTADIGTVDCTDYSSYRDDSGALPRHALVHSPLTFLLTLCLCLCLPAVLSFTDPHYSYSSV